MKFSIVIFVTALMGCNQGIEISTETYEGGLIDSHPYMGPVCCQITDNLVDDPKWNDGFYICDPDAGISKVTVGGSDIPWVCGLDDGGIVFTCDDPRCIPGNWCNGMNGYGHVTNCQSDR